MMEVPPPPLTDELIEAERLGTRRFRTKVAVLIVAVSVFGAIVAWRASVLSSNASDLDQAATQQSLLLQQTRSDTESSVALDLRLFGSYQEDLMLWRMFTDEASSVRRANPTLSDQLESQARDELDQARTLRRLFTVTTPDFPGDANGRVEFDPKYVINIREARNPELAGLRPNDTFMAANRTHDKTVKLVGIAALLAAALFFLTIAQLTRRAGRRIYAAAGTAVLVVSVILFVLVEWIA